MAQNNRRISLAALLESPLKPPGSRYRYVPVMGGRQDRGHKITGGSQGCSSVLLLAWFFFLFPEGSHLIGPSSIF